MPDVLLLVDGDGNLLLTDGTDLLLVSDEPPPEPGYQIQGRRLVRIDP